MRLRKIELHGFKTFANRATLEFAPGITAIVGPNGSGKSNVADAIRWVLGEQSLRLLRGRKTEDVIFGGGNGRAPLGMAEVTLTLDNADGALPPEYSEVSISRRAFRSGEGEYGINRSRVRLRDVVDLLSRAGIGQNGHSVVGQGLVDMALSLRPEERRGLFEDAAGMRRYHAKKAEAEHKLAEASANATRVADLITELEPRVAQLQRQARRAQDESRLREQWQAAARTLFGHQRWEIERQLGGTAPELERLAAEGAAATAAAAAATMAIAAAREQLALLRGSLGEVERERSASRERADSARREAAVAQERYAGAQRTEAELRGAQERLAQRAQATQSALPAAERARAAAATALEQARGEASAAAAALQAGPAAGDPEDLRQARALVTERARALTQASTQLREAERQLKELSRQVEESADGRKRAEASLATHRASLERLEKGLAENAERSETLKGQTAEAQEVLTAAEQRLRQAGERATQHERDAQALRVRLNVLRDVVGGQTGASAASGSKAPDKDGRKGAAHEPGPRLAEQLQVPAEIEAAVAAAVGAALEWVLVETAAEAHALAERHARERGRRTTFISRDALTQRKRTEYPPLPAHERGLGYLVEALPAADGDGVHAPLLADSYLVEDLPAALALAGRLNRGLRPAIVTLAGELVHPLGAVTAGAPPDEAGTLQRLRELRETEAKLAAAETARAPLAQALEAARKEHAAAQAAEREIETQQRALAQEASRLHGEQRALGQQQLRLERDARWWTEFAERSAGQLTELRDRMGWLSEHREQAEAAHAEAEARAAELASGEAEREARLAALRERASGTKTAAAVAEQRLLQSERELASAQAASTGAERELEAASTRLNEVRAQLAGLEATATAAQQHAHTAAEAHSTVDSRAAALARSAAEVEAELERRHGEAERAQARAAQAERDVVLQEAQRATLVERARALQELAEREIGELPPAAEHPDGLETLRRRADSLSGRLRGLGPVNQVAMQEHQEASERLEFLKTQLVDLREAAESLERVREELDAGLEQDFGATFNAVAEHFRAYFTRLFGGGDAQLLLTDPKNLAETGVEIMAQLPGKRRQELALLSGGERSLVAAALLFALLKAKPSPFCVLDEVDAALDEANVGRFCDALSELADRTQFIVVTHNRATMERAGALYGVTLGQDGVSRVVSLRLEDAAAGAAGAVGPTGAATARTNGGTGAAGAGGNGHGSTTNGKHAPGGNGTVRAHAPATLN